jgi:hypothetical protein
MPIMPIPKKRKKSSRRIERSFFRHIRTTLKVITAAINARQNTISTGVKWVVEFKYL